MLLQEKGFPVDNRYNPYLTHRLPGKSSFCLRSLATFNNRFAPQNLATETIGS
jgi:hypothetical protein